MLPLSVTAKLRAPWPPPPAPGPYTPNSVRLLRIRSTGCDSTFHRSRSFPSLRFRLAGPGLSTGHSLAFDSLRRVRSTASLRLGCYPCLIQAESEPPGRQRLHQAPVRIVGSVAIFRSLRCFPSTAFTSRIPSTITGHSLAFDSQRCVKPATSSGLDATPESFRPNQSPLAAVLLRQVPPSIVITRSRGDF